MIIPNYAIPHAEALLKQLQRIPTPTEPQRRFIGALRKSMGMQSNNEKRKTAQR